VWGYRPVCRVQRVLSQLYRKDTVQPHWQPLSSQLQAPFWQPQKQLLHWVVVFELLLFIVVSLF
jgi:hypothetical protein